MLVDTQPTTHQNLPATPDMRDQWVEARLIGMVMDRAMPSLVSAALALPVLVLLMWGEVNGVALAVWAGLQVLMLVLRYRMVLAYRLRHDSAEGTVRRDFIRGHVWSWGAVGLLWGGCVGLTFYQADLLTQFVCGLVVMGHGLLSVTAFSTYQPVFRANTHALSLSVLAGLIGPVLFGLVPSEEFKHVLAVMALLVIFWWLLRSAGDRLREVHQSRLELEFSNQELIDSLTQQTRAALRAVATKNRFLASAAHDLRQPVHALSLYADWLATEPEMAREIAPRILQSTRAINELFDSLFDLTRIDAGNYKVRLQHVDVQQLFADMTMQFEPVAAGKSLRLRTHCRPTTIWADPVVLRRILGNLVSNALRHTQQGGVLLGLRHRNDMLVFEVWDTGVGIAREHRQAIFQEFFRVSQHQGTEDSLGLGLTIVSKLTSLMGYQLALNSQANKGSVFRVMLPAFTQKEPDGDPEPTVVLPLPP
jgi:signal transduction histidine kinase